MPESDMAVSPAPLRSIIASNRLSLRLHLTPDPRNRTFGLLSTVDPLYPHMCYLGKLYSPPEVVRHCLTVDAMDPSPDALSFLAHCQLFQQDPILALSRYIARLHRLMTTHPDSIVADEYRHWQIFYRQAIEHVLDWTDMPEDEDEELGTPHLLWRYTDEEGYLGRPRTNLQGLRRIPVYRALWPHLRPSESIPVGRPKKLPRCGEVLSQDPAENTRMCVNPHHFISAVELKLQSTLFTEPGIEAAEQRVQWRFRDLGEPRQWMDGTWAARCPNDHIVEGRDYDRLLAGDIRELTCRGCQRMVAVTKDVRGRLVRRTRNRHEPLISEMAEQHRMQQRIVRGPQVDDPAGDDDFASWTAERWAAEVEKMSQQNPD